MRFSAVIVAAIAGLAVAEPQRRPYNPGYNPDNLLSNTVKGVSKGVGAVVEPFAAGGKEVLVGLADGAKGILGGTANALSGVFGLGSDFLEALTGLRPFKQRDIEQLAEIRVALAPIVQRYAAEQ